MCILKTENFMNWFMKTLMCSSLLVSVMMDMICIGTKDSATDSEDSSEEVSKSDTLSAFLLVGA